MQYKKSKISVYLCFLDFSKAFDKVNRELLMHKLANKLNNNHWAILYTYYKDTTIVIKADEKKEKMQITLGVKQGGPLSPRLFSTYVNDMITEIKSSNLTCSMHGEQVGVILYADDTVVACPSEENLNAVLNIIHDYCERHEIQINNSKTKCMIINEKNKHEPKHFKINNHKLEIIKKFKYLGWWIEDSLGTKEHMKNRKLALIIAAHRLKNIGFNTSGMNIELKKFLNEVYCSAALKYGIENTYLNQKDYYEITSLEGKIIKSAFNLNKYHSTSLLISAIEAQPLEITMKIRKLNFIKQLLYHPICYKIIKAQLEQMERTSIKSLVHEVRRILNKAIDISNIERAVNSKIAELEEETLRMNNRPESRSIRYLLENNSPSNQELAKNLLHWDKSAIRKRS